MNGKAAKLLRTIGRASHADKRAYMAMDSVAKGIFRKNVEDYIKMQRDINRNKEVE